MGLLHDFYNKNCIVSVLLLYKLYHYSAFEIKSNNNMEKSSHKLIEEGIDNVWIKKQQ